MRGNIQVKINVGQPVSVGEEDKDGQGQTGVVVKQAVE